MKRTLFLLMTICLMIGLLTVTASAEELSGTCSEGKITWVLDEEGTITFTGEGCMEGVFVTPSGEPTSLEHYGWMDYKDQIRRVVIHEGIISAGGSSFSGCKSLTEVELPDSLQYVEKSAFSGCDNLTSITLPTVLELYIDDNAFAGSGLTEIILPDNVMDVGTYAFFKCENLTYAKLSNHQFEILRESVFQNCTSLTKVDFGTSVNYIADHAFYNTGFTDLVLPETVTFLDNDAFGNCRSLKTLDTGGVGSINKYAFLGCRSLETVTVRPELYLIDWNAFKNCENIRDIYISDLAKWCQIELRGTESSPVIYAENLYLNGSLVEDLVIPKGVTELGGAFTGLSCIKTVMFADSVTFISSAFRGCSNLTTAVIPASVERLSNHSFYECGNLQTIYYQGTEEQWAAIDPWKENDSYYRPANVQIVFNYYSDVSATDFYAHPVLWANENAITTGISATEFGPNASCNRAQVVTFLWRAAGSPEPTVTENPFVDVEAGSFYEKAVLWAVEKGITTGTDGTHFSPNMSCNRAQVVTFLHRAMGNPDVTSTDCPFTDVAPGAWYEAPILWAVENGITNGMAPDTFGVNTVCNRAQVVTFLYRTYVN